MVLPNFTLARSVQETYLKPFHIAFRPVGEELACAVKIVENHTTEDFYDLYAPALYGIILRTVKAEKLAELILQDVFLKEIKSMRDCAPNGKLFALLANTARRLSKEKLKEISHLKGNSPALDIDSISILALIYFEGYTLIEAAEKLNISIETLKNRLRSDVLSLRR